MPSCPPTLFTATSRRHPPAAAGGISPMTDRHGHPHTPHSRPPRDWRRRVPLSVSSSNPVRRNSVHDFQKSIFAFLGPAMMLAAIAAQACGQIAIRDVDLVTSRVYVLVDKTGLGHEHAVIGRLRSGHVHVGAAAQAGTLVFDMRSFQADTTPARKDLGLPGETDPDTQRQVNENMLGPAVLHVARHPTATLTIESALRRDGNLRQITC